jgi:hypothetical protein
MLRITTAFLLLSPAIASAQCLTADALDAGITVEYGSGDVSYIQRQPDGIILNAFNETSSYYEKTFLFESFNGVFETGRIAHNKDSWEGRSALQLSYDFAADAITEFSAGESGSGIQTENDPSYGPTTTTFGWSAYARAPLEVGDCSYEAVRVFTTSFSIRYGSFDIREVIYLPELGIGVQTGNSYFGFSPENSDIIGLSAT